MLGFTRDQLNCIHCMEEKHFENKKVKLLLLTEDNKLMGSARTGATNKQFR